jgi:hypothetical protein
MSDRVYLDFHCKNFDKASFFFGATDKDKDFGRESYLLRELGSDLGHLGVFLYLLDAETPFKRCLNTLGRLQDLAEETYLKGITQSTIDEFLRTCYEARQLILLAHDLYTEKEFTAYTGYSRAYFLYNIKETLPSDSISVIKTIMEKHCDDPDFYITVEVD